MSSQTVLIAGIGNIFFGDDAFGVEVAQRLLKRTWPPNIRVQDFGIRGLDLTYALLEPWDLIILIDAVPRDQPPGTVYVIEPEIDAASPDAGPMVDAHAMDPVKVLQAAVSMGAKFNRVILVGCQPTPFDAELDMQMELSPPARAAVDEAISVIESLLQPLFGDSAQPEMIAKEFSS
jgi:hydrogenase maturation protease